MANTKIQTSRKRVKRRDEDLRQPDEVTTALQKLGEHLSKHLKLYMAGLAAVLVVALGGQLIWDKLRSDEVEQAAVAIAAFDAANGTVATFKDDERLISLDPTAAPDATATYATDAARWDDALAKIEAARGETDSDLVPVLDALKGRVQLAKGDAGAASTALAAFVAESDEDSALLPIVIENQGRAAETAGDAGTAAGFYEKLAGMSDQYYKVRGSMLLGDLYNPAMHAGKGDAGKAAGHYDTALKGLVPGEGKVASAALRSLRAEISRRKAQLEG